MEGEETDYSFPATFAVVASSPRLFFVFLDSPLPGFCVALFEGILPLNGFLHVVGISQPFFSSGSKADTAGSSGPCLPKAYSVGLELYCIVKQNSEFFGKAFVYLGSKHFEYLVCPHMAGTTEINKPLQLPRDALMSIFFVDPSR